MQVTTPNPNAVISAQSTMSNTKVCTNISASIQPSSSKLSLTDRQVLNSAITQIQQAGYQHIRPKRISYTMIQNDKVYQGLCYAVHEQFGEVMVKWQSRAGSNNVIDNGNLHEVSLIDEIEVLTQLDKSLPVIEPLSICQMAGFLYISLPFYQLGNLTQCLKYYKKQLSSNHFEHLKRGMLKSIAEAINELHQSGWIHGDIKPSNILVRECQQKGDSWEIDVLLIDLALARRIDANQSSLIAEDISSAHNHIQGTPAYLAPECWGMSEEKATLSVDSDWYAFGVLFYQVLQEKRPFDISQWVETTQPAKQAIKEQQSLSIWFRLHTEQAVPTLATKFVDYQMILECLMSKQREQRKKGSQLFLALMNNE